jgi:hypothetical protein
MISIVRQTKYEFTSIQTEKKTIAFAKEICAAETIFLR